MTLNKPTHKTILFQILKDIYSDSEIAPYLGFKGGTAAVIFYGLDRFSVDLDFDLLDDTKEDLVYEKITKIVKKYGDLKKQHKKYFNLFWLISYEDKGHNIKIEINRRKYGSIYKIKTYLGVSMMVMRIEDMFAHKIMAMYERIGKTSRDIYDVCYFLKKRFSINFEIVEKRSKKSFKKTILECISKIEKMNNKNILDGLGELLDEKQKDRTRAKLREETISLLQLRINK